MCSMLMEMILRELTINKDYSEQGRINNIKTDADDCGISSQQWV